jgi:hypothetical protein
MIEEPRRYGLNQEDLEKMDKTELANYMNYLYKQFTSALKDYKQDEF